MWKIIEDLKSLEIKANHHKDILDEVYEDLDSLEESLMDIMNLHPSIREIRESIRKVMDKLEDM